MNIEYMKVKLFDLKYEKISLSTVSTVKSVRCTNMSILALPGILYCYCYYLPIQVYCIMQSSVWHLFIVFLYIYLVLRNPSLHKEIFVNWLIYDRLGPAGEGYSGILPSWGPESLERKFPTGMTETEVTLWWFEIVVWCYVLDCLQVSLLTWKIGG